MYVRKVLLVATLLFLISSGSVCAQYVYKWSVGGTMGFGSMKGHNDPGFTMSATIGFDKVIKDTKWRWGIEKGMMNQGISCYAVKEDEPDRFMRPNFVYVGGVVDYSVFSKDYLTIFTRGGLAPALRRDTYIRHIEDKYTGLGIIGIGVDYGFNRLIMNGYLVPGGYFVLMFSYGWWFGKLMKP